MKGGLNDLSDQAEIEAIVYSEHDNPIIFWDHI